MVWESEVRVEHNSELLNTLCWWDQITKYIDWEVRKQFFTIVFWAYQYKLVYSYK